MSFTAWPRQQLPGPLRDEYHDHPGLAQELDLALQLRGWPELGNDRRAIPGKPRVLVAPPTAIFSSLHPHGTHQAAGGAGPQMVPTRALAEHALGLTNPRFEPLDLP